MSEDVEKLYSSYIAVGMENGLFSWEKEFGSSSKGLNIKLSHGLAFPLLALKTGMQKVRACTDTFIVAPFTVAQTS